MTKNKRLESIDLLKGVAILLVILCHSRQLFPNLSHTFDIFMFGQMACQLFFVIAGYTSCVSYFNHKKQKFFLKRLLSILPAYYLTGILAISLGILSIHLIGRNIGPGGNTNPIAILSNLFFLNGLIPIGNNNVVAGGWFIGTLMIFYLLFPLFIKLFNIIKKNRIYIPFVASIIQILTILLIYFIFNQDPAIIQNNGFVYFNAINQLSCYLFGILAYYELNNHDKKMNPLVDLIKCFAFTLLGIGLFYGNFKFAFVIITNIIGLASYYALKTFVNYEKISEIKNTKAKRFLCSFGEKSLYLFLSHPFFVYTLNVIIIKIWQTKFYCIDVNVVYLLSLPIVLICSFFSAKLIEAVCSPISKKMVKYTERS